MLNLLIYSEPFSDILFVLPILSLHFLLLKNNFFSPHVISDEVFHTGNMNCFPFHWCCLIWWVFSVCISKIHYLSLFKLICLIVPTKNLHIKIQWKYRRHWLQIQHRKYSPWKFNFWYFTVQTQVNFHNSQRHWLSILKLNGIIKITLFYFPLKNWIIFAECTHSNTILSFKNETLIQKLLSHIESTLRPTNSLKFGSRQRAENKHIFLLVQICVRIGAGLYFLCARVSIDVKGTKDFLPIVLQVFSTRDLRPNSIRLSG